jgi:aminoglycoside phosphotransferase family enzyme/predicted kinase
MVATLEEHEELVRTLMDERATPGLGGDRRRIDTHISTVVLLGDHAYKIKKPLDLGFLDYSTLAQRRQACEDEVRLNRRLAPQVYLRALPVTGTIAAPSLGGSGDAIDWAVHMHRFDPDAILANRLNALNRGLVEKLAWRVARFHGDAPVCSPEREFGLPESVYAPMDQNFSQIRARRGGDRRFLDVIAEWTRSRFVELRHVLDQRREEGHIRECHGDLHLGNVALIGGEPVVFDAIEFNPSLSWIDTVSDVAFLTMDLTRVGRVDLAHWFLDSYLRVSGDYSGLRVLRFYEVYRALVRAKIAAIRLGQRDLNTVEREQTTGEFRRYMRLAEAFTHPSPRAVVITQGVAGTGKSTVSGKLLDHLPAVRVRSDVERKRLAGLAPDADAITLYNAGIYSADMTERTYSRLADIARGVVEAGFVAIVDATFLRLAHRQRFADLAASLDVPFVIIDCEAPEAVLRERIRDRMGEAGNVSDADLDVLAAQLESREPLTPDELAMSIPVRPERPLELDHLLQRIVR